MKESISMNENVPRQEKKSGVETILPELWLGDINQLSFAEASQLRAVKCLEHVIRKEYPMGGASVLEVGPVRVGISFAIIDVEKHLAPITLLKNRNDNLKCLAIGPQHLSEEDKVLLEVDFVIGLLTPDTGYDEYVEEIVKNFKGNPQIIFGQNVFENSSRDRKALPFGSNKVFEKAAEILETKGLLVVDNSLGTLSSIGWPRHLEYSKKMKLVYEYKDEDNRNIYVFKKM